MLTFTVKLKDSCSPLKLGKSFEKVNIECCKTRAKKLQGGTPNMLDPFRKR